MKEKLKATLESWPGAALSAGLIGVALLLLWVAVVEKRPWLKAAILAYVVLP